jgi:inhibitor of cysteine peptidase
MQHHTKLETRFWLTLCLSLTAAAAASMPIAVPAQTTPPATVELGELGQNASVQLRVGDTLRVVLPANVSTGYSWQVASNDAGVLQPASSQNGQAAPRRMGAPGQQTLSFTARAPGQDHLTLTYARPWEKGTKPARTYSVTIAVSPAGSDSQSPAVTPAGTLIGTYSAKSRCADCSGILTTVAFYAASPQQMTATYYVRRTKYLGSPKGDTVSVSAGKWSLKTGTAADAKAAVYSLRSNTSDHVDTYQLSGDTLLVIGSDGKPAQNPYNTNLQKQPCN